MRLIEVGIQDADRVAPLVAGFRVRLRSLKGTLSEPDTEAGKEEILEYLNGGYPVFAVEDGEALAG